MYIVNIAFNIDFLAKMLYHKMGDYSEQTIYQHHKN